MVRALRISALADSACSAERAEGRFSVSHGGTEAQRRGEERRGDERRGEERREEMRDERR